jgi:chromosome partitioning protein
MILLVGAQKGGCGKSTTAVNICAALVNQGKDVCLVDSDIQQTSSRFIADRVNTDKPVIHCVQKYEYINETLKDLATRYEYVVVDAAGRDSIELRTGMLEANVLLVPFRPSQPDLDTLPRMREVINQSMVCNPGLRVFGLLTMVPTNPQIKEEKEAAEYLSEYPEIELLDSVIRDRKVYRDCMAEGVGVVELANDKAKLEIESLVSELWSRLESPKENEQQKKSKPLLGEPTPA